MDGANLERRAATVDTAIHSLGWKLRSHRVSVFEALVENDRSGLTIPEISRVSRVPSSTTHRIIKEYSAECLVIRSGKRGKAPIFRVNSKDPDVVEAARALHYYTANVARRELASHGEFVDSTDLRPEVVSDLQVDVYRGNRESLQGAELVATVLSVH